LENRLLASKRVPARTDLQKLEPVSNMECVIPGRSVKIFAKIIHCLSKVGDELFLEPAADKVPCGVRMNYKSMPGSSVAV